MRSLAPFKAVMVLAAGFVNNPSAPIGDGHTIANF
jgi:hypothetical protein